MSGLPKIPAGSGTHPITMVALAANDLVASTVFYGKVFDWKFGHATKELAGGFGPAGPGIALRADTPPGFPGAVPFVGVANVEEMTAKAIAAGAETEHAPWAVLGIHLSRFRDLSKTVWGVTDARPAAGTPSIPPPFADNPKPPDGTLCSVEMYAREGSAAGKFFADLFGWGWGESMPGYTAFDPGAGIGGVFQSHTPTLPAMFYVYTSDVAKKLADIEASGGNRTADPMSAPGLGTFGYFQDPSGTHGGLIGP